MPTLFWDIETRSMASLEETGAFRYAADPSTEVLVIAYAVDEAEPQTWILGQDIPAEFIAAASDPSWLVVAQCSIRARDLNLRVGAALRLAGDPGHAATLHHGHGVGQRAPWRAG